MFRTLLIAAPLAVVGVMMLSPASAETQAWNFTDFTRIETSAGVSVKLVDGPYSIKAEGDLTRLKIEKNGDRLIVTRASGISMKGGKLLVTISSPTLTALSASAGSSVEGDVGNEPDLAVSASSGASISLRGAGDRLSTDASSGASIDMAGFTSRSLAASAQSGASIRVVATEKVAANASSGGSINVTGGATGVAKSSSSGGSISVS